MPNISLFEEKITQSLNTELTTKELAQVIIVAALESEYGSIFTRKPGFAKMVNTLGESVLNQPELRRQVLALTSTYLRGKSDNDQKSFI